jgi:hypothetical protein
LDPWQASKRATNLMYQWKWWNSSKVMLLSRPSDTSRFASNSVIPAPHRFTVRRVRRLPICNR